MGPTQLLSPNADGLYVYDVALWIGAKCVLEPQVINLNAGTRRGAELPLGRDLSGRSTPQVEELSAALQRHSTASLASMLCALKP